MPTKNTSIISMLDTFVRVASLFLKKWAADLSYHFEELSDYQSGLRETSSDIIDVCVFNAHDCVYGLFTGRLFKPDDNRKKINLQPFQMSARTRARIHNEYAMDQLRKNVLSLSEFSDCAASIQLLSCFRTKGDPDARFALNRICPSVTPFFPHRFSFTSRFFFQQYYRTAFSGPEISYGRGPYFARQNKR